MVLQRSRRKRTSSLISRGSSCPLSWAWEQGWELPAALQELHPLTLFLTAPGDSLTGHTNVPAGPPTVLLAPCAPASLIMNLQEDSLFIPVLTLMKNQKSRYISAPFLDCLWPGQRAQRPTSEAASRSASAERGSASHVAAHLAKSVRPGGGIAGRSGLWVTLRGLEPTTWLPAMWLQTGYHICCAVLSSLVTWGQSLHLSPKGVLGKEALSWEPGIQQAPSEFRSRNRAQSPEPRARARLTAAVWSLFAGCGKINHQWPDSQGHSQGTQQLGHRGDISARLASFHRALIIRGAIPPEGLLPGQKS